ncbi:MAG: hypothetical protein H7Y27_08815 [Gemmatimonadaceae bacterium]|nr:hypothetical protein [Chitinophagaceae bacterium]
MRYILILCCLFSLPGFAQWKNYVIGVKGDTLNRVDKQDRKQGPWIVRYEEIRGEPGYEEEGEYKNGKKEGAWRRYSLTGDIAAIENYRWGFKDGMNKYFNLNGELVKEEGWRALNPDKVYDTIDVEDPASPDTYKKVIVKNEGASLKHGTWKYYDATAGFITKTEFYLLGKLENNDNPLDGVVAKPKSDSANAKAKAKPKPKEVLDFEKQNSGKKKVKVRDGKTF